MYGYRVPKVIISLAPYEHDLLINGFNDFRNKLLEEDKPTEDVDVVLRKLLDAKVKEKRCFEREDR